MDSLVTGAHAESEQTKSFPDSTLKSVPDRYNLPGDSGDAKKQRRLLQFSFFRPDRLQPEVDTLTEALVPLDVVDEPDPPVVCAIGWLCTREEDEIASAVERLAVEGRLAEYYGTTDLAEAVDRALSRAQQGAVAASSTRNRMPVLKGTPIGPIRSWCIQFGIEPRIYVETDDAWYHVVYYGASPEYAPLFESARSKFEIAVRADLLCAKNPGVRLRPAVDLTYGYVTFALTLPFAGMRSYTEEHVHEVAPFLLEQAAELDSYLPESHFLSVLARRAPIGGAPSQSLSADALPNEKRRHFMYHLRHLLAEICRRSDARELRELTNPQKYPGYEQAVPVPLDLNLIMHRLHTAEGYTADDPAAVVRDVRQVFHNCRLFLQVSDKESQKILVRATRVEHFFDERLLQLELALRDGSLPSAVGQLGASLDASTVAYDHALTYEGDGNGQQHAAAGSEGARTPDAADISGPEWSHQLADTGSVEALRGKRTAKRRRPSEQSAGKGIGNGRDPLSAVVDPVTEGTASKPNEDARSGIRGNSGVAAAAAGAAVATLPKPVCAYPICTHEPRRGSKYCSDECGCAVAVLRLAESVETLPRAARKALLAAEVVVRGFAAAGKEAQRAAELLLREQEKREQEAQTAHASQDAPQNDRGMPPEFRPPPPLAATASAAEKAAYASLNGVIEEATKLHCQLKRVDAQIAETSVLVAAAPEGYCGFGGYCQWSWRGGQRPSPIAAGLRTADAPETGSENVQSRPCPIHGNWRVNKPLEYHRERQHVISRLQDLSVMYRRLWEHLKLGIAHQSESMETNG